MARNAQWQTHRSGVARVQCGEDPRKRFESCPIWWTPVFWWTITAPRHRRGAASPGTASCSSTTIYGYGRNQQTCYREALAAGADMVIMVHPDYQYTPLLVTAMASMVAYGVYDMVLGSRILGGQALTRRNAALQVHLQPFSHRVRKSFSRAQALGIPHRLSAFSAARC